MEYTEHSLIQSAMILGSLVLAYLFALWHIIKWLNDSTYKVYL